jgi:hypothetical protein
MTQFRVIEALAMVDGSVGWCAMISCDAGYIRAFLDQNAARAMFPDLLSAMGAAATATATVVPGATVSADAFPYVSGCHHCEWLWLGCHVVEDGAPRINNTGVPETRQCLLRLEKCEILDLQTISPCNASGISVGQHNRRAKEFPDPSEERIGRYISHRRTEYYLASKCGCLVGAPPAPRGQKGAHLFTRDNVVAGVEQSLARMKNGRKHPRSV